MPQHPVRFRLLSCGICLHSTLLPEHFGSILPYQSNGNDSKEGAEDLLIRGSYFGARAIYFVSLFFRRKFLRQ